MQKQQLATQPPALTKQPGMSSMSPIRLGMNIGKITQQARKTLKGRFILLATFVVILAITEAIMVSQSYRRSTDDLNTINSESIPSVNAAQTITQYIEDIDAKAADYLATAPLTELQPCSIVGTDRNPGPLTVHDCDDRNINAELILANKALFNAAHNVTFPGERTAVERIFAGLEEYASDIAIMRQEYTLAVNPTDPNDPHSKNARIAYQNANNVLQNHITQLPILDAHGAPIFDEPTLPTCHIGGQEVEGRVWALGSIEDNLSCLSEINKTHLDNAYNDTANFLSDTVEIAIGLGLIFCLLLAFTTLQLMRVTHRVINIGVTLALLVGVIFSFNVVGLFSQMSGQHGAFGQMVKDDYASIYSAALLKRYGTAANADESRWLIALAANDQTAADHWYQDWQQNTAQVRKYIKSAQDNRTWPEEDQPLRDLQHNWAQYFAIDGQIRSKATDTANPNRILDAERLSTGDSNRTFDTFAQAVDRLSAANLLHYNATLASTQGSLMIYFILSTILFPLIGLAAAFGISVRLKDF